MPKAQYKRKGVEQKNRKEQEWSNTSNSSGVSSLQDSIESIYSEENTDDENAVTRKIQPSQQQISRSISSHSPDENSSGTSTIKSSIAKQRYNGRFHKETQQHISKTSPELPSTTKIIVSRTPTVRRMVINEISEQQSVPQLNITQPLSRIPLTSSPSTNVHQEQQEQTILNQVLSDELTNFDPNEPLPQIQTPHAIRKQVPSTPAERKMQMLNLSTPITQKERGVTTQFSLTSNEEVEAMITSPRVQKEGEQFPFPPDQREESAEENNQQIDFQQLQQEMEQQEIEWAELQQQQMEQMQQQQEEIDHLEYFETVQLPLIKREPIEQGHETMPAPNPLPPNASRAQRVVHQQQTKIHDYHREKSMIETRSIAHRIWFKGGVWVFSMDKMMFNHEINSDQFLDLGSNLNILADIEYFRLRFIHMQDVTDQEQMIKYRNNHASCVECSGILLYPNCHPECEQRVPHTEICNFLDLCVRRLKESPTYKTYEKILRKLNDKRTKAQLV